MNAFAGWENFYVIVGSSAGALIGLQFVVITLIANRPVGPGQALAADAFATPTIVYFGTVLLASAVLNVPWHAAGFVAIFLGCLGLVGILYAALVVRRMRAQTAYAPEFEDWLFHVLLPFAAYATIAVSGFAARTHARGASFGIATASLLLLFTGIHNAWDAVTYHIFSGKHGQDKAEH